LSQGVGAPYFSAMTKEVFIGGWTRKSLAERSQNERHAVWRRARALHSAEGNHLARAIEKLGLPYAEAEPLADDDPLKVKIGEIIASPAARSAAIEATLDGLPAMAGIDGLLHDALGQDYRLNAAAVPTAQALVAILMGSLGYVEAGRKPLPTRCVARDGVYWKRA